MAASVPIIAMTLHPCASCWRHIDANERSCPFRKPYGAPPARRRVV